MPDCLDALCAAKGDKEARQINHAIERELNRHKKRYTNELRLLLLGAGESGKSTIVKQMRIIYTSGFSVTEREQMKRSILCNICSSIKILVDALEVYGKSTEGDLEEGIAFINDTQDYDLECIESLQFLEWTQKIWADPIVKEMYLYGNELQLFDSAKYFLDSLDRIKQDDYIPDDQDLLMARIVTTGIFETKFEVDNIIFHMFDVGGQRPERRKWIQCFADVTGIIFTVATSGYNQCLREDLTQNRLQEAIELFESIWMNRWLQKVSVVLFLNKCDILRDKIQTCDLGKYFPSYTGGANFELARKFIKKQFLNVGVGTEQRRLYCHYTIATNTDNIKRVFNDIKDIVLRFHLAEFGLV